MIPFPQPATAATDLKKQKTPDFLSCGQVQISSQNDSTPLINDVFLASGGPYPDNLQHLMKKKKPRRPVEQPSEKGLRLCGDL